MKGISSIHVVLCVVLSAVILPCFSAEQESPKKDSKYLEAVREFADNVLKYGRDTYGPKHTPLFVDGLNIHTHEPVKWIAPNGDRWILSNLASQQNLFRTLDGLTKITGDPKYRQAAMEAIDYALANLRHPNGLFYWGHATAYDAGADDIRYELKTRGDGVHSFKLDYPYYELMWEVNSKETKKTIEAFWSAHIIDWSNLDFDRYALFDNALEEPWNHEYDEEFPTFFKSKKSDSAAGTWTGTSLIHAGTTLYRLSGEKQPLIWSKRLAERFIDTRHPKTGISYESYTYRLHQFGDNLKEHFNDPYTRHFPQESFDMDLHYYYGENVTTYAWMSMLLAGEMLGKEGKQFKQWALEEFAAWGKASYRKNDNSFVPILTDGTSLEGYVWKEAPGTGSEGLVVKPLPADMPFFWAYSVAYRITGDGFMWEMVRDIALGNNFGDIGETSSHIPELQIETSCSDAYGLLGFLQLYEKTSKPQYLEMAQHIGDNILSRQFHKGFFVLSKKHIYSRFDCLEPLALLHLDSAMKCKTGSAPQVWPSVPLFIAPYRYKQQGNDRLMIYTPTESSELPLSLQEAAAVGDVNLVRTLIEKGADVDSLEDSFLKTALHRAAMSGHKDVVELLLAEGADVEARDRRATPLHYAAEKGHKEIAELLIGHGADVNAKRGNGDTPLHSAARAGHKDIIELLIANGADINANNNEGQTPIDIALSRNRKDIVQLLLAKGATISSIHIAAQMGDLAGVKALLERGADVNAQDDKGDTALHYAVHGGHKELVEFLIAKGADVNAKTNGGYTPLTSAIWRENKDIIKILITKGADVNFTPRDDYPPLHYAIWNEDVGLVKLLVDHGAKFNVKDMDGWTAFRYVVSIGDRELLKFFIAKGAKASDFHTAAWLGDLDKVKRFMERGTDVNTEDEQLKWTPLHWAAFTGPHEVAKFLLAKGANVNAKDEFNSTPLQYAAVKGHKEFVELLLARGADVNATDNWGSTPLHAASRKGHHEVVALLIAKGPTINAKDRNDRTPLYRAAMAGHRDIVEILIANGADIDAKDKSNQTALHMAIMRGRKDMVALLIAKGADVNSKDSNGQTPLHSSVREGSRDIAELLIANGADMNAKNRWNRTPLDLATDRGHTEIVELLRNKGAKGYNKELNDPLLEATANGDVEKVKSLLSKGADVNAEDWRGTVLHIAAQENNKSLVEILLSAGANVDAKGGTKITPLHHAAVYGYKDIVELLIDKGADLMVRDSLGHTPLHSASSGGHRSVAELFIAKGADVNAKRTDGQTPLHAAAMWGHPDVAELLIREGADVNIQDKSGRIPLWYAKASGNEGVVRLLTKQGLGHDVAVADISVPSSFTQGERISVVVDLLNKSDYSEKLAITLINVTNATIIGTKSVCLSPVGINGMDEICDLIFTGESPGRQLFGCYVYHGDVNGDGYDDLLVTASRYNDKQGRAYLYYGGTNMDENADKVFTGEKSGGYFSEGSYLADLNSDGYDDVILGAFGHNNFQGRVYIYYGGHDMDERADVIIDGEPEVIDGFGRTCAAGDVNGDGYKDLFISAIKYPNN